MDYFSVRWFDGIVKMIDQRLLPGQALYREYITASALAEAIQSMVIRGAPAIGIAAGYGMALTAFHSRSSEKEELSKELSESADILIKSRPTAVNLFWAIERIMGILNERGLTTMQQIKEAVIHEAIEIHNEDIEMNKKIGEYGRGLLPDEVNVIHHCNTGALATGGYGTALGVIRAAHEHGKRIHVFVDETRPRLQGARLTSWELKQLGISHTVIVDGASGYVMRNYKIDACLAGCDRVTSNGDVANKIGTYNLAIVAKEHGVPFYTVGPVSSIDFTMSSGDEIPIEERSAHEINNIGEERITPEGVQVMNPAFDVTPAKFITAIITNEGIAKPPFTVSIAAIKKRSITYA